MTHPFAKRHRPGGAHDKADQQKKREQREKKRSCHAINR